jgi:hypothetical protein
MARMRSQALVRFDVVGKLGRYWQAAMRRSSSIAKSPT